jgi:hypothetical protein
MKIEEIFESIRDIPYRIPLSLEDASVDCDKKHKMLAEALTKEGFTVRFRVCSFLWSKQSIPKEILDIPHVDTCEHLFLEIFRDGQWDILDISWDKGLQKVFTICEWDKKDNALALVYIEMYPPDYSKPLTHNESEESFLEDIYTSGKFYDALNKWLEQVRD